MHTREKMSPELRAELERIEDHERAAAAKAYLDEALDIPIAFLRAPLHPNQNGASPFEVEFFWDEPEFGSIIKFDLREYLLERFVEDPDFYRKQIAATASAMRQFSDELEAILLKSTPEE